MGDESSVEAAPAGTRLGPQATMLAGLITVAAGVWCAYEIALLFDDGWMAPVFLLEVMVLVVIHELGHVVFGALVGMRVSAIRLGDGPLLATGHVGTRRVELRLMPFAGRVRASTDDPHHLRVRVAVLGLGGIVATLVVSLVGILLISDRTIWIPLAFACVVTAFAFAPTRERGRWVGDAIVVRMAVTAPLDVLELAYVHPEVLDRVVEDRGDVGPALADLARRGDDAPATDWTFVNARVSADTGAAALEPLTDADADRLVALATRAGPIHLLAADVLNERVYRALLQRERPDPRFVSVLRRVHRTGPPDPAIADTLAFAVIEAGDPVEGLVLSQRALAGALTDEQRASVLCVRGLAFAALGRADEGRECRQRAAALHPECGLLGRLDEALAEPG